MVKIPLLKSPVSTRKALVLAAAGALVIAVLGVLVVTLVGGSSSGPKHSSSTQSAAQRRAAARGWTDKVTVPLLGATQMQPSQPRPATLPPMIRSSGACELAMNKVRDFQDAHPSGLVLTGAQFTQLSTLMLDVGPAPKAACTPPLANKFRLQELAPWMSWQPPAGYPVPVATPAGRHPKTATKTSSHTTGSTHATTTKTGNTSSSPTR